MDLIAATRALSPTLNCKIGDRKCKCILDARTDAELEIWAAIRKKKEWFEKVFERKIEFELQGK